MPAYAVEVSPTIPNPTHHMSLIAEDGTRIGLILCDATGDRLPTAISRANLQTIPVKTSSGDTQYGDQELPFFTSAQQDWSAGIGNERFEDNRTKYHGGRRIQTVGNKLVLGPREHFTTGYKPMVVSQPTNNLGSVGRIKWTQASTPNAMTYKFTVSGGTITTPRLYLFCKAIGTLVGNSHTLNWQIRNDDAGPDEPGTLLKSGNSDINRNADSEIMRWVQDADTGSPAVLPTLVDGTTYWLVLTANTAATTASHVEMGYISGGSGADTGDTKISNDVGATWPAQFDSEYQLMFRISRTDGLEDRGWYGWYRNQLYFMTRPLTGAPTLLMNGWRGVCDSNSGLLQQLRDATQTSWAGDTAVGSIVYVFGGPGSDEAVPYREVTSSSSGILTLLTPWNLAHTTDTEYVVLGSNRWETVVQTIPSSPTGPWAIGDGGDDTEIIAYIPLGHAANEIWMFRQYNNAGVFTTESKGINNATGAAGAFRAKRIVVVEDDSQGTLLVKIEDNVGTGAASGVVAEARAPGTWTSQLGWGGDERLGQAPPSSLVNAIEYVDPNTDAKTAWAITQDELFARKPGAAAPQLWAAPLLPELKAFRSERTGYALAVFNTALFISLAGGLLERLTGGNTLTDVGPNKGVGLSNDRQGEIESLVSYPGQLFVATTPSGFLNTGYSTITRLSGQDSHDPIYESPIGRRIRDMTAQSIPNLFTSVASTNNRLWFQEGEDLMYVDLPSQGQNPLTDPDYQFAAEGMVSSSRIYASLNDRRKVFSSLKIVSDALDGSVNVNEGRPDATVWIIPEHQVDLDDEDGVWTRFINNVLFTTSPSQELFLTDYTPDQVVPIRGRYLKTRMHLNTTNYNVSPVVRAHLIESLVNLPNKFSFKATVLFEDNQLDLRNNPYSDNRAWQQAGRLQEYGEQGEVFTLESPSLTLDGAKVIISPPEVAPIAISKDSVTTEEQEARERLVGTLTILQVILPDLDLIP